MSRILDRVFVVEFYRVNAGFFLIVIGLGAGVMGGREHMALAGYFVSSFANVLIPTIVWVLYSYKIIVFNKLTLYKHENEFVFQLNLISSRERLLALFKIIIQQIAPVMIYAVLLVLVAAREAPSMVIAQIILTLLALVVWITWKLFVQLASPDTGKNAEILWVDLHKVFVKPPFLFYTFWITYRQPLLVLGTNIFGCVMIHVVCLLYTYEAYDARLLGMGWSLAMSANLVLIFYYHRFENFQMGGLLRTMPFSIARRLLLLLGSMLPLMLAEVIALAVRFPDHLWLATLGELMLFSAGISLFFYGLLFKKDMTLETHIRNVFSFSIVWIVLILFKVPVWALGSALVVGGVTLVRTYYYTFEFDAELKSEK